MRVARPHLVRAAAWALLALAGLVAGSAVAAELRTEAARRAAEAAGAAVLLLAGIAAVRAAARALGASATAKTDAAHGAPLARLAAITGYVIVVLVFLDLIGAPVQGLLLGGALTGVVIGIAAQQTLGNFFAGIVLLVIKPFRVGDYVVLRSGPLGGEFEGRVTDMGMFYVDLDTARGPVSLPNSGVLAAAIGPGARSAGASEDQAEA